MSSAPFALGDLFDRRTPPMQPASVKRMRESGQKLRTSGRIDAHSRADRIAAFLRAQHPLKTPACVEAETGIPAATVRKWLEQGYTPSGDAILTLIDRYEDAFLTAVFPDRRGAWFAEATRRREQRQLERQIGDLQRKLAELGSRDR